MDISKHIDILKQILIQDKILILEVTVMVDIAGMPIQVVTHEETEVGMMDDAKTIVYMNVQTGLKTAILKGMIMLIQIILKQHQLVRILIQ